MSKEKQINDPVKLQQRIDKTKKTMEIISYKIRKGMYASGQECDDLFYHYVYKMVRMSNGCLAFELELAQYFYLKDYQKTWWLKGEKPNE